MNKLEFDNFVKEQQIRQDKGYLRRVERETLKDMIANPDKYITEENVKVKKIVTNIEELRRPCVEVIKGEKIDDVITSLRETLKVADGLGLSANQIGINKKISVCNIPKMDETTKKIKFEELILINPRIVEMKRNYVVKDERCLSFPGCPVTTDRYVFITLVNHDKDLKEQTFLLQDLEALIIQHEVAHLEGKTIFDFKHKAK